MRKIIQSALVPRPIGVYSQAVQVDSTVYLSGQIGMNAATGDLEGDTFEIQLQQIFTNMTALMRAAGGEVSQIVKLTVYLRNFDEDYPKLDEKMRDFFFAEAPARTTVGVAALPKNALVEIDAIATLQSQQDF